MIKSLISTAMAGIPRTGTSGKEPSKFVLNAAKNMAASIPISNKKATIPVPKKKEEKDNKILDAMIKNRIETIKPKIRGTVSVGAQEYSKNPFDLIDFLFEARKECIENYPILNWNSNLLKGGIGSIKKGGTKLGKKYGTYLYEKKIPFVSDMVGEFHGVRKETKKSTAGSVTGALFKGVLVDGFGGTVEGVANIVADPLETVGGLVKIAANPKETASAIWNVVKETWDKKVIHGTSEERAVLAGQAVFEIGSLFVGVGETKAAASGAKAADITGDVGKITSKSRRIIKKVEKVKGKASKIGKGISYKKPIPKSNPQNVTVKLDEVISSLLKKSGDGLDELRKGINRVMNGEMEYSGIGKLDEVGETGDKIVGKLDDWKKAIQDNLKKAEKKESGVQISGPKGNGQTPNELGELIGKGGNKEVYAYGKDKVVAIMQDGKPIGAIDNEISMLKQLDELGLPTVNAEKISIDGKPGILMDKCAQESKSIAAFDKAKGKVTLKPNADTSLLNQNSINDLNLIKNKMLNDKIKIDDLQFLIKEDGHIVIADPLKVTLGQVPSKNNIKMIDIMIEAAKKN